MIQIKKLKMIGILLPVFWAVGIVGFAVYIPQKPTFPFQRTDAIVVLTGGPDRIREGLHLFHQGLAPQLFITGVHKGATLEEVLKASGYRNLNNKDRIFLDYDALNTIENAQQTAGWTTDKSVKSIRLVTASYHMPRALLEIAQRVKGVEVIAHPITPRDFNLKHWWRSPKTQALIFQEYHKFLAAVVRAGLRSAVLYLRDLT